MIQIFLLSCLALSALGRPQNDSPIDIDLIPARRNDQVEMPEEFADLFMNETVRQNDGTILTDLIPARRDDHPEMPEELAELFMNVTERRAESRAANTCGCAAASSSGRIVGGSEVSPKYKYPYQVYFQVRGQNASISSQPDQN